MKIHLFKSTESTLYFLGDHIHITKLGDSLEKYSPFKVQKIQSFNIRDDFKKHPINADVNVLIHSFFNYFNHFFGEFNTNSSWYNLDETNYQKIIDYLNTLKPEKPKTIKEIEPKSFRCYKCNQDFTSDTYLERHLLNCLGLKCEKCDKTFTKKHNYKAHIENCGDFTCEKCNKTFNSRYKYLKHLNKC